MVLQEATLPCKLSRIQDFGLNPESKAGPTAACCTPECRRIGSMRSHSRWCAAAVHLPDHTERAEDAAPRRKLGHALPEGLL